MGRRWDVSRGMWSCIRRKTAKQGTKEGRAKAHRSMDAVEKWERSDHGRYDNGGDTANDRMRRN